MKVVVGGEHALGQIEGVSQSELFRLFEDLLRTVVVLGHHEESQLLAFVLERARADVDRQPEEVDF